MNIDNSECCPNCEALLEKGEDVCQSCGKAVKIEQKEK